MVVIANRVSSVAPARPADDGRHFAVTLWLVAALVNFAAIVLVTGLATVEPRGDEQEYVTLARRLYEHGEFLGLRRTPLWPGLMAAVFTVTGPSIAAGKILNALLGAFTPVGVLFLGRQLFDRRTAALAAGIVALLPTTFIVNATLYSETAGTVAFVWTNVLLFWLLSRADPAGSGRLALRPLDWVAFGAALAVTNLVKPAFLLWMPLLVAVGVWHFRRALGALTAGIAVASIGFVVVMAPWWVRNWQVSGHFVPFSTAGDQSLLEANNPGLARMDPQHIRIGGRPVWTGPGKFLADWSQTGLVDATELAKLDDVGQARYARVQALAWIEGHPREWLGLVAKKLGYGFGVWPLAHFATAAVIIDLPFLFVLIVSLRGWVAILRHRGRELLLLLHPICFVATTVLFYGSWRYRNPYEPSFVLAAAVAVGLAAGSLRWRRPGGALE